MEKSNLDKIADLLNSDILNDENSIFIRFL